MTPKHQPSVESFGQYVVVKPDIGARGADVRIARSTGLTWRPPKTSTAKVLGGPFATSIVQEFIYSGPWPRSYRVTTLFGEVLWSVSVEASHALPRLNGRNGFAKVGDGAGASVVSSGKDCTFALSAEPDLMELARDVHRVFPEIPLLGVDFVRDFESGRPYIVEVNSAGLCWHFTSPGGLRLQREMGFHLESQFDGRRRAAKVLAERAMTLSSRG
jgi:glutathione synthase/RimK-type ligase-like ATP-grasp enzyme